MKQFSLTPALAPLDFLSGIDELSTNGITILSPSQGGAGGRVLFVNCYGGPALWEKVKAGEVPSHHLWGCIELVHMGYEVALVPALSDFYLHRNPFPHDLKIMSTIRSWLGRDGIVYCGHNVLYWLPFLKSVGIIRCRIVSLLYGREPLHWARAHDGIIALNPAAEEHARMLAPKVIVKRLAWGVDLNYFPELPYNPVNFLSCGRSGRDFPALNRATFLTKQPICIISAGAQTDLLWPPNVTFIQGSAKRITDPLQVSFAELIHTHYGDCAASLVVLESDPKQVTGCGFTSMIEAMAMSRPLIATRTGASPGQLDVEATGCGLWVEPGDHESIASAIDIIAGDLARSRRMGERGRQLCEQYYNMNRYSRELRSFFEAI